MKTLSLLASFRGWGNAVEHGQVLPVKFISYTDDLDFHSISRLGKGPPRLSLGHPPYIIEIPAHRIESEVVAKRLCK